MDNSARVRDLQGSVTILLQRINDGDEAAQGELFDLLYPQLRRSAEVQMQGQPVTHTLQATALVNEVFMKLVRPRKEKSFADRSHFLRAAAKAMRHTLIDHARRASAEKRSGQRVQVELDAMAAKSSEPDLRIEDLEAALAKLEAVDPRMAEAVELRFFGGATVAETAEAIGLPQRTFEARWRATRDWLLTQLQT